MESSDKKKIIIMLVVTAVAMIGMSVFMRTGFQSIARKTKDEPRKEQSVETEQEKEKKDPNMIEKIGLQIGDAKYTMTVDSGKAGQEFAKSTPFQLEMKELNGNEKYYEGTDSLPTNPYKPDFIEVGDVMLYGDKTIVIFYKSFNTEYEYTRLGKIDNEFSLESALGKGDVKVDFYKIGDNVDE